MKHHMISVLSVAVFSIALTACTSSPEQGAVGDMKMPMGGEEHDEEITFGAPGMANMVTRTVTVNMEDVAYDLKKLMVKDGETIRFIVINKDDADHEFTLGTAEMQAEDRERMAKMMDMGMKMEMEGEVNAISVPPLKTMELIWTFKGPAKIEFACNVPGHYEVGMRGDLIVM